VEHHRSWISLVGFCLATTLAAAITFAIIVAGGSVALASHQGADANSGSEAPRGAAPLTPAPQVGTKFSGMITDSHCGARHMSSSRQNSAECARACFRKGAGYVLIDGDRRYTLVGAEDALAKLAGERVNVFGNLRGDTIIVDSVEAPFSASTQPDDRR
jgi:hypothetical protein